MCRLAALILPSVLHLSRGQQVFCPAQAAASCAAAAEAAGEGDSLELMQVTATAKRLGGIMGAETLPAAKLAGAGGSAGGSAEERFSGVWLCQQSHATGAKVMSFRGGELAMHDSCAPWAGRELGDSVHVTSPDYAAGVACDVSPDSFLLCSNGDNCSRLDVPVEGLLAAEDQEKYTGTWLPADGSESDGFNITVTDGGEFFYQGRGDNSSGFLHLTADGYWQADSCFNGYLVGTAMRLKLSKSGKSVMASFYIPGFPDWSPAVVHQRPAADGRGFPVAVIAFPLVLLIFGVPATFLYFGFEGKGAGPAAEEKVSGLFSRDDDFLYFGFEGKGAGPAAEERASGAVFSRDGGGSKREEAGIGAEAAGVEKLSA